MEKLRRALVELNQNPCPLVKGPPGCDKRAAVAIVIRVRPAHQARATFDSNLGATSNVPFQQRLNKFFAQSWVQDGVPEVLLIKRATREGDRWTGQVALPGGRQEEDDADDLATSIRETREETGLELDDDSSIVVGNLPQRVVTTSWGKRPFVFSTALAWSEIYLIAPRLMVLCPYVMLCLRYDIPPLDLQPSEVHSAHWVPLPNLMSPEFRTFERADMSDRAMGNCGPLSRILARQFLGYLEFSAVALSPSESIFSDTISTSGKRQEFISRPPEAYLRQCNARAYRPPLLLWGLTLGMLADFLDKIDSRKTATLWSWPTFSHYDLKLCLWVIGAGFRRQRLRELQKRQIEASNGNASLNEVVVDNTTYAAAASKSSHPIHHSIAGGHLIDGYFELMNQSVKMAFLIRLASSVVIVHYGYKRWLSC